MKTNFSLFILSLFAFVFTSCQKSADQMVKAPGKSTSGMIKARDFGAPEDLWAKIYPFLIEPRETKLGEPGSMLFVDDKPVFFILISDQVPTDVYTGTITLTDAATGDVLAVHTLISNHDPAVGNVIVPDDLKNGTNGFLFVQGLIDAGFTGKTVNMSATVSLGSGETLTLNLPAAFSVLK